MRPYWLLPFRWLSLSFATFGGDDERYHKSAVCALDPTLLPDLDAVLEEEAADWVRQLSMARGVFALAALLAAAAMADARRNGGKVRATVAAVWAAARGRVRRGVGACVARRGGARAGKKRAEI